MRSNELTPKIQQIKQAKDIFVSIEKQYSDEQWLNFELTHQDVINELDFLISLLGDLSSSNSINKVAYTSLKQSIFSNIDQVLIQSQNYQSNPLNFSPYIIAIVNAIIQLEKDLLVILPRHDGTDNPSRYYKDHLSGMLKKADIWVSQSQQLKDELDALVKTVHDSFDDVETKKAEAEKLLEQVEELLDQVQEKDRQTQDALNNAKDAAAKSTSELNTAEKNLAQIQRDLSKQESLIKHFEDKKQEIADLLEGANKVGLAKSFQDRKKEVEKKIGTWYWSFVVSVGILALLGAVQIILIFFFNESVVLDKLLIKFLSITPVIWFAWFSVRQYGFLSRIAEDYAFKEAAAMSFVGYRNEVSDNEEMIQLLQEYAIKNFGKNPADLLSKNTEHSSPAHEAIDKLIAKMNPKELLEFLSSLKGNKP